MTNSRPRPPHPLATSLFPTSTKTVHRSGPHPNRAPSNLPVNGSTIKPSCPAILVVVLTLLASAPLTAQAHAESRPATRPATTTPTPFTFPCDAYLRGLRGKGNFGLLIRGDKSSPFDGSWHLAEDVWLPARTPVRSVAAGRVTYSDFSPSWIDGSGQKHWNLGNVIVIEHELDPPEGDLTHVCSVYVHLAKDRAVRVGDPVTRGQPIGFIGADRSPENGDYPAHLHFGIHRGPYIQIAPSWQRKLLDEAATLGMPIGGTNGAPMKFVKGHPEVKRLDETTLALRFPSGETSYMSLLVGSTAPDPKPADIIHWCSGYGSEPEVAEWLRPSDWIRQHEPPKADSRGSPTTPRR